MTPAKLSFHEKLVKLQTEINVPKGQYNDFGNYSYRSCEDILGAMKDLLKELGLSLKIQDHIELIGERYYVRAIVTLSDGEKVEMSSAYARESLDKKGMDHAQVTGSTSSYARKYALSGLLGLDDEDDADSKKPEPKNTNDVSRFQNKDAIQPGDYIVPGGIFAGKKISEIGTKELTDYCVELTDKNKGKLMDAEMKTFIDTSREYLRTVQNIKK